jgi:hypothetical protein
MLSYSRFTKEGPGEAFTLCPNWENSVNVTHGRSTITLSAG